MASSAEYPYIRSAAGFQLVIVPSVSLLRIASSLDSTIAAKCSLAVAGPSSPVGLLGAIRPRSDPLERLFLGCAHVEALANIDHLEEGVDRRAGSQEHREALAKGLRACEHHAQAARID